MALITKRKWSQFCFYYQLIILHWQCLWTDSKDYLHKFASLSDIELAIQKFCAEIPVSIGKLFKVLVLNIYNVPELMES